MLFPEYKITTTDDESLSTWKLRCRKEEKLNKLRHKLQEPHSSNVKVQMRYYVSNEARHGHPIGTDAVHSQKLHPQVTQKIMDMVKAGMTDVTEIRRSLKYYVDHCLCKELGSQPHPHDRSFYPVRQDISNHVSMAKRAIDLSSVDQENLQMKIKEWKKVNEKASFYYRPAVKTNELTEGDSEQQFLYIHQEEWQKELLVTYGNTITLMDATYKTTKYSIPLFFICVRTNVEFVVQSENTDQIFEALSIVKSWSPSWYPSFFITDYSDAEMSAITKLFPNTQLYLCDFHREQAWERWVKDRKHGLTDTQSSELLDLLRDCANSPVNTSVEKEPTDYFFKQACDRLQMSDVWKRNEQVRKWISTTWFSCSKFWARCLDLSCCRKHNEWCRVSKQAPQI